MIADHVTKCAVAAVLGAPMPPAPCCHLADCDEPAPNLMPDPCPNCGRWYVNDDNSVEPETYDGRRRRGERAVYGPDRMKVPPYRPGMHDHISEDDGKPGSGQPRPRATQQGAATPGHGATAQGAVQAVGNVAEPKIGPAPDRADRPSSSDLSLLDHLREASAVGLNRDAEFVALRRALWIRLEQCQNQAQRIRAMESACADLESNVRMLVDESESFSASIIALLDSDATAGQLRAGLALLVGR